MAQQSPMPKEKLIDDVSKSLTFLLSSRNAATTPSKPDGGSSSSDVVVGNSDELNAFILTLERVFRHGFRGSARSALFI